ncbi:MAG TPA: hypothetical protein VL240_12615 [Candidatus Binatia bacterium]|nr:hypothetical protein [Candidatus Binatia bacterium]
MKICASIFMLTLCCAALAQEAGKSSAAPVEVAAEPSHHLKLENEYVRAYYVEIAPGQSTLMHHHSTDYIGISLGPAEADVSGPDGKVKHVMFQDGQVSYAPAGVVHAVADAGSAPFRNATIELLQNQGHPVCVKNCESDPRAKDWPALPATAKLVGYGDTFRIIAVTIKPQQTVSILDPSPHLAVLLSDAKERVTPAGESGQNVSHHAGDIVFHGPHAEAGLTNTGAEDIRLVEIQFKAVTP